MNDKGKAVCSEEVLSLLKALQAGEISSADLELTTNPELLRNLMASDDSLRMIAAKEFDRRYERYILHAAQKTGASEQEAWDVLDMVRGRVLREISKYDSAKGRFRNWLWTMVRNLTINEIKKRRMHETHLGTDADFAVNCFEQQWEIEDLRHLVKSTLERMFHDQNIESRRLKIFCEYALGKHRARDVAERFGVTENAVHLTKHELTVPFRKTMAMILAEESGE